MAKSRQAGGPEGDGAPSDVYTGLLVISLGAMVLSSVLLLLDYSQYSSKKPEPVPAAGAIRTPAPPGK